MSSIYFVIPAGGVGTRMNSETPKQYLPLLDKTVLEVTLDLFLNHPLIEQGVIGISDSDHYFNKLGISNNQLMIANAGATRAQTVYNGLLALHKKNIDPTSWVIVHDAARPGLSQGELTDFINQVKTHDIGGIMALPACDTIKKTKGSHIEQTLDRTDIYYAQTPQMFRLAPLLEAFEHCFNHQLTITDESSAMEVIGHHPIIVEGYAHNFKVTYPADIDMMNFLLAKRASL